MLNPHHNHVIINLEKTNPVWQFKHHEHNLSFRPCTWQNLMILTEEYQHPTVLHFHSTCHKKPRWCYLFPMYFRYISTAPQDRELTATATLPAITCCLSLRSLNLILIGRMDACLLPLKQVVNGYYLTCSLSVNVAQCVLRSDLWSVPDSLLWDNYCNHYHIFINQGTAGHLFNGFLVWRKHIRVVLEQTDLHLLL